MNESNNDPIYLAGGNFIVSNYIWILVSIFGPLLAIIPILRARHMKDKSSSYSRSHYEFQAITIYAILAWFAIDIAMFIATMSFLEPIEIKTWFFRTTWLQYIFGFWVAIRTIRGLYLAGGRKPIDNPKAFMF